MYFNSFKYFINFLFIKVICEKIHYRLTTFFVLHSFQISSKKFKSSIIFLILKVWNKKNK